MNCWDVLGLLPTDNKREIKRAYAKILKNVNPEDRPREFQILSEAYQDALKFAGQGDSPSPLSLVKSSFPDTRIKESPTDDIELNGSVNEDSIQGNVEEIVHNYMCDLAELYNDPKRGVIFEQWTKLIEHPDLLDLEVKAALEYSVFGFFAEVIKREMDYALERLLDDILKGFDKVFQWQNDEITLCRYFPDDDIDRIMAYLRAEKSVKGIDHQPNAEIPQAKSNFIGFIFMWVGIFVLIQFVLRILARIL